MAIILNAIFLFVVFINLSVINVSAEPDEMYTTKFDHTDVDAILKSKRLMNNYVNCLLDKGSCNPDGAELKKNLHEALETDCKKCSDLQKKRGYQVIIYLHEKEPEVLKELKAKYDPNGDFQRRLCKRLEAGEFDTHHRCTSE